MRFLCDLGGAQLIPLHIKTDITVIPNLPCPPIEEGFGIYQLVRMLKLVQHGNDTVYFPTVAAIFSFSSSTVVPEVVK